MMETEPVLQPFEEQVRDSAASRRRRLRMANVWAALKRPFRRASRRSLYERMTALRAGARAAADEVRTTAKRTTFEVSAVAHSSATLAGVSKDAERAAAAVKAVLPKHSAALQGLRQDIARVANRTRAGFQRAAHSARSAAGRAKASALRSSTVTGLAIDSQRVVKRVKQSRANRRGRFAH